MTIPHAPDITEAIRLVTSGVHVNITGPRGSDLPSAVGEIARRLEERGGEVTTIEATAEMSSASFGALRLAVPDVFSDLRDPAAVIDRFCLSLRAPADQYLIIHNVDQLDPFSLRALSEALRRTPARVVSTLSSASARFPDALVEHAHAQVVVRSLSHFELEAWLNGMTDHPLEQELVTRLYLDSRGRPTFARISFLSGIREGKIVQREGFWTLGVAELWTSEISFTVASSLATVSPPLLECLRAIAIETAPAVAHVVERFSAETLTALEREGLLGIISAPGQETAVTVTPPVVARHLDQLGGRVLESLRPRPELIEAEIDEESVLSIELTRATARRAAAAHQQFDAHPCAPSLIDLVQALWAHGAPYDDVEPAFRGARERGSEEDELHIAVLHANWLSFGAGRFEEALALLDDISAVLPAPLRECAQVHRLAIDIHHNGVSDETREQLASMRGLDCETKAGRAARITSAMLHYLTGRARTAMDVLGDKPADPDLQALWIFTAGFALFTADRPAEAVALASRELAVGRERLDADLVFVSSFVLVTAHMFLGNWGQAQQLARTVRSIGRPNLYTIPVYRTTVGIQAIVFAEEGNRATAGGLIQQAERPGGSGPLVFAQPGMLNVVTLLADRDYDALSQVLSTIAEHATVTGSDYAASFLWAFAMGLDPALAARARTPEPGDELDAYDRLRSFVTIVAMDDLDRATVESRNYPQSTFAYLAGLALIRWGQRVSISDPERGARYSGLADELYLRLSIPPPEKVIEGPVPVLGLSPRELQIALLASRLTNREISERLAISERTVDHHISNSLRKSGARNRRELSALVARIHDEW